MDILCYIELVFFDLEIEKTEKGIFDEFKIKIFFAQRLRKRRNLDDA